jgi:hypothetical protein
MKKYLLKKSSKEAPGCHSKYVIIELSEAVLRLDNMIWMELDTTDEKKAWFICDAVNEKYEKEKENTKPKQK